MLGMSLALMYTQARSGGLPGVIRLGDRLLLNREAFDKFVAGTPACAA